MLRKRRYHKAIAIFLGIQLLSNLIVPQVAKALTEGPSAPEYDSFEPVDVTNMVNTSSGDFSYVLPLLEVPGPEGSYPVSLSYHAGITPDREASWVGLGWTLNAGSINRSVNGYPDDLRSARRRVHDYWDGGERTVYSLGIGFTNGLVSTSVGVSWGKDTYKGFGIGAYQRVGYGTDIDGIVNVSASRTIGKDPFGGAYISVGVGAGVGQSLTGVGEDASLNAGVGASAGLTYNFKSRTMSGYAGIGAGISVGYEDQYAPEGGLSVSLLSASLSTNSPSISITGGGANMSQNNNNQGQISTNSSGFGLTIPCLLYTSPSPRDA